MAEIKTPDGDVIGVLEGGVFKRDVRMLHDFTRKVGDRGAWGLDLDVVTNQLSRRTIIQLTDLADGTVYKCALARWLEYGEVVRFDGRYDDGVSKLFLPVEYFDRIKKT